MGIGHHWLNEQIYGPAQMVSISEKRFWRSSLKATAVAITLITGPSLIGLPSLAWWENKSAKDFDGVWSKHGAFTIARKFDSYTDEAKCYGRSSRSDVESYGFKSGDIGLGWSYHRIPDYGGGPAGYKGSHYARSYRLDKEPIVKLENGTADLSSQELAPYSILRVKTKSGVREINLVDFRAAVRSYARCEATLR